MIWYYHVHFGNDWARASSDYCKHLWLKYELTPYEQDLEGFWVRQDPDKHYILGILHFIVFFFSIAAIIVLVNRHRIKRKWQNQPIPQSFWKIHYNYDFTDRYRSSKKRIMSFSFLYEVAIILIQPIPFLNSNISISDYINGPDGVRSNYLITQNAYFINDFLLILMFLWLIILARNFFNYSKYSDVFAKRLCDRYGFTANMRFCFKCYILKFPIRTVLFMLFFIIFLFSYIMRILERPFHWYVNDFSFDPFLNSVYCTVITMATCGYGDIVPWTQLGKVMAIIDALYGGFIVTLTIVTLGKIFNFTP